MSEEVKDDSFVVIESERSLVIQHRDFGKSGKASGWGALKLDNSYLILSKSKALLDENDGFGFCSVQVFKDFIRGLAASKWSGVLKVDCNGFMKKVYFSEGRLSFASSTLIDDRLGERMYRTGRITLDQLVESASQVDRNTKFGQVLIRSQIMNAVELWQALKDQVLEIFRSVFMSENIRYSIESGNNLAFMEVVFEQETSHLIDEGFSYAQMLRNFGVNLLQEATIEVSTVIANDPKFQPGTFTGDIIDLINTTNNVGELITNSKLRPHNTLSVLLQLICEGICRVKGSKEEAVNIGVLSSQLNSKIDVYSLLLRSVQETFASENITLPVDELRSFAYDLNEEGDPSLSLDENGAIDGNCRRNIYYQCALNGNRIEYFVTRIEALIQFQLQLVIDLCPFSTSKKIRQKYREMVS